MAIKIDRFIILHTRSYQESSLLIEALAEQHGRLSFIAKGIKNAKKSHLRAHLQLAAEIETGVSSRGNLKSLNQFEVVTAPTVFVGERFAIANYVSELCLRLLPPFDAVPVLYRSLRDTFAGLTLGQPIAPILRKFESQLINALGIMPDCQTDIDGNAIEPHAYYRLIDNEVFQLVDSDDMSHSPSSLITGGCLINMLSLAQLSPTELNQLKLLNRRLLDSVIGGKPLYSRRLWHEWNNNRQKPVTDISNYPKRQV